MALDVTPQHLAEELQAGKESTEIHHHYVCEQYRKFHGYGYKRQSGLYEYHRENHAFDWVSLIVPKLVMENPRVKVGTRLQHSQSLDADAIHYGLNRWVLDNDPRNFLVRGPVLDMQFTYGVGMVAQKPVPRARPVEGIGPNGSPGRPYSPKWYHIPPEWYTQDPLALTQEQVRFQAHRVVMDKDDLLAMAKREPKIWNKNVIEQLAPDTGVDDLGREKRVEHIRRGEVVFWQVWVPEHRLEESRGPNAGYHGTWFWLPDEFPVGDSRIDFLRKPAPFFGHWSGPYQVFGAYNVPRDPFPLGPLTATMQQQEELNRHAESASRAMADWKRLIMVMNCNNQMQQIVKDGESDYVFDGEMGPDGKIVQLEIAGLSDMQLEHMQVLQERLQRLSGLSDAQRGLVSGRGTATENAIADAASDVRIDYLKKQITEATIGMLTKTAFYLWRDQRVAFPLGPEISQEMGMEAQPVMDKAGNPKLDALGRPLMAPPEAWFRGGPANTEAQFDDLELDIEPYSMERTSQAVLERNANFMLQLATGVVPVMAQVPQFKWKELFDRLGDAFNIPDLGDLIDEEMVLGQAAGPNPNATKPQLAPQPKTQRFVSGGGGMGRQSAPSRNGSSSGSTVKEIM